MKAIIQLLFISIAYGFVVPPEVQRNAFIEKINKGQKLWKAEQPNISLQSVRHRLMDVKHTILPPDVEVREPSKKMADAIPAAFDSREQWPACPSIGRIRDQSDCGSCWAFAATEAMSDRLCIATNGQKQAYLSDDDLLSCCGQYCGDGCGGGYPIQAWKYWVSDGIVTGGPYKSTSGCRPYEIPPCGHHPNQTYYGPCPDQEYNTPTCKHKCQADYDKNYVDDKYYGSSAYAITRRASDIQIEIMTNGPVEVAFTVYEDFYYYKNGVYVHTSGTALGGHAVRILGWGVDNGTPYWLVANSWNTDWGENGYFRIIRGVNECGIEGAAVAGEPKI